MTVPLILVRMEVAVLMVWTAIPVYVLQATLEKTAKPTLMTVHPIHARTEEAVLMV
jgi:hypothetical protein